MRINLSQLCASHCNDIRLGRDRLKLAVMDNESFKPLGSVRKE